MLYGFRFSRNDLQAELVREVQASGASCYVDAEGFLVVQSEPDRTALDHHVAKIKGRLVTHDWWHFGSEGLPTSRDAKRREAECRGVPFLEYDTFSDDPRPWRAQPHTVWRFYALDIRRESSLPKGQRPWDRA